MLIPFLKNLNFLKNFKFLSFLLTVVSWFLRFFLRKIAKFVDFRKNLRFFRVSTADELLRFLHGFMP